ncbi:MAG: L-histidine N(alpha)-methyltransferase [Methylocystis sp.]
MMRRQSIVRAAPCDAQGDFALCVVEGLSRPHKRLPCRFFYDARGSALFEDITRLPEYYPTRVEIALLEAHAEDILQGFGEGGALVEFGSGSSRKTEILLAHLPSLSVYAPIDVSKTALDGAMRRLAGLYPSLGTRPILGDFTQEVLLPADVGRMKQVGFFPGSTIGNFDPPSALALLRAMRRTLARGSALVIGVDLKKDARVLIEAYNDAAGVTAAFNLNLLARANRELGAEFDLAAFRHEAIYDPLKGRIEMHLVSVKEQRIEILGERFHFRVGERIHTENSYKFSLEQFSALARAADWRVSRHWTDARGWFAVFELREEGTGL